MESLLRWGIENSASGNGSSDNPPPRDLSKLDPGIIDQILGKSEAVQMKEALTVATDETAREDDRVTALDNFEMLIENIDNANNITSMNMWEPLIGLLDSSSETITLNTLWILGTAIQNNPKAQEDFLARSPLAKILGFLQSTGSGSTASVRSKAVYCLSGALKHNRSAVQELEGLGGWKVLHAALSDEDASVRRKVAFLLNALLLPDGDSSLQPPPSRTSDVILEAMPKYSIPTTLVDSLVGKAGNEERSADEDFEEKVARALLSYLENGGEIQRLDSQRMIQRLGERKDDYEWELTTAEWEQLQKLSSINISD